MTDRGREKGTLAAEYALGVLSGEERRAAATRASSDPEFARNVANWRGRLAPLLDQVEPVEPPQGLWSRIEARSLGTGGESNVIQLRRRVSGWRAATVAMTAIAASLGLVLLQTPHGAAPVTIAQPAAPPMVAMLGDDQKHMKVVANWDPGSRRLVLAVAGDMPADPAHAHELWVIPAGGKPRSLGTMPATRKMHMQLAETLARLLQQGATIAISIEPPGGSRTGAPTGPVVVSGSLDQA